MITTPDLMINCNQTHYTHYSIVITFSLYKYVNSISKILLVCQEVVHKKCLRQAEMTPCPGGPSSNSANPQSPALTSSTPTSPTLKDDPKKATSAKPVAATAKPGAVCVFKFNEQERYHIKHFLF